MIRRIAFLLPILLIATAGISSAQTAQAGDGSVRTISQLEGDINHLIGLLNRLLNPGVAKGFNPQPDPPHERGNQVSLLLPAVQRMLNFTLDGLDDPRAAEILRRLRNIMSLYEQAMEEGSDFDSSIEQIIQDFHFIQGLLHDLKLSQLR